MAWKKEGERNSTLAKEGERKSFEDLVSRWIKKGAHTLDYQCKRIRQKDPVVLNPHII